MSDHILKLSVIDAGKTKRRNVIGYVTFPLRDLPSENEQTLYKMDLEKVGAIVSTGTRRHNSNSDKLYGGKLYPFYLFIYIKNYFL